jgi:deoxyribodipyrimidine photo-lyase
MKNSKKVIPVFIFTPEQVKSNPYKSSNAIQFMIASLVNLDKTINGKLNLLYGKNITIILNLIKEYNITDIYTNTDYTPYAVKRDNDLQLLSDKYKINLHLSHDICLYQPSTILNKTGKYYQKFTPFYNTLIDLTSSNNTINKPLKHNHNLSKLKQIKTKYTISFKKANTFYRHNFDISVEGGRDIGLIILKNITDFRDYDLNRNILVLNTTRLSAYLKFGCLSIREVYHQFVNKLGKKSTLVKQLVWRDFYYHLGYGFSDRFGLSLKEKYDNIIWKNDKKQIEKWMKGETGYPIVDACMREMNTTGFMHNRGRLIVSGFLIKNLQVDWRIGERYFATQLVDYDVLVNQGNWQWSSGSGADSQPYFRIFNPWLQSKKHDEYCKYIKKWLPILKDIPNKEIHQWHKYHHKYPKLKYPKPIIDYSKSKDTTLKMYKKAFT